MVTVDGGDRPVRVKMVDRPGLGRSAKADIDDVAGGGGFAARDGARRSAEATALGGKGADNANDGES